SIFTPIDDFVVQTARPLRNNSMYEFIPDDVIDDLLILWKRRKHFHPPRAKYVPIHGAVHRESCPQQRSLLPSISCSFLRHNFTYVKPRNWGVLNEIWPRKMAGVVRANGKLRSRVRDHLRGFQHEFADSAIITGVERRHPCSHGNGMQRDFRMVIRPQKLF